MIAGGMTLLGVILIVGVAVSQPKKETDSSLTVTTNTGAPTLTAPRPNGKEPSLKKGEEISDKEWEAVLKTLEEVRHTGLVTDIDADSSLARVKPELWEKLPEAERTRIGQALAVFCGRSNESGRYEVTIKAEGKEEALGTFKKTFD